MSPVVEKVIGADFELGNSVLSKRHVHDRAREASVRLLAAIPGYPERNHSSGSSIEFDRRFLPGSGGSAYIDSDHCEINTPEHLVARDHALHVHAGFRIARRAQLAASQILPSDMSLAVLANNCDGHVSYGRHLNVLTTSRCFDDILYRKPHLGGFLATHLVTSVIYSGQGMVGAANGRPACDYQLSQRADWFECFSSHDTMTRRPLLNLRDESHAASGLSRLHIIYYDTVLSPLANWLQAGTTQLVVAMCEAGWIDPAIQLDDPIAAASQISRDLSLVEKFPTAVRGRSATAVQIQRELARRAGEFVASGEASQVVPNADEIVRLWLETLDRLQRRDIEALVGRCDNWLKYLLLNRHRGRHNAAWNSAEMKALDLRFSSLDPADSLFFQMAQAGVVEGMPSDEQIDRAVDQPPDDTRAYLRAHVLRRFGHAVSRVDWGWIEFRVPSSRGWWSTACLSLRDPRRHTKSECVSRLAECRSLNELVAAFSTKPESDRGDTAPTMGYGPRPAAGDGSSLIAKL